MGGVREELRHRDAPDTNLIIVFSLLFAIIDSRLFKMKYDPSRDKVPIIEGGGRGGDPGRACVGIK